MTEQEARREDTKQTLIAIAFVVGSILVFGYLAWIGFLVVN